MEKVKTPICWLCLNVISDGNFKLIEKTVTDLLLLKQTPEENSKPLMCNACSLKLLAAFEFKTMCMDTEVWISLYINSGHAVPVDIRKVYLREQGKEHSRTVLEGKICRLCMQLVPFGFTSVEDVEIDKFLIYIPEINFNITKRPVICAECLDSLNTHSRFLRNFLDVEQQIQNFRVDKTAGNFRISNEKIQTKSRDCGDGNKIMKTFDSQNAASSCFNVEKHISETTVAQYDIKAEEIEIKSEENYEDGRITENLDPLKNGCDVLTNFLNGKEQIENVCFDNAADSSFFLNTEDIALKSEEDDRDRDEITKNFDPPNPISPFLKYLDVENNIHSHNNVATGSPYIINIDEIEIKSEETDDDRKNIMENVDSLNNECNLLNDSLDIEEQIQNFCVDKTTGSLSHITTEVIEIKPEENGADSGTSIHNHNETIESGIQYNNRQNCSEHINNHTAFDPKSQQDHNFETYLQKHGKRFKRMYKCLNCDFKTKNRESLSRHRQTMGNDSKTTVYKCSMCGFEFKQMCGFKSHLLTCKRFSVGHTYECTECNFKTKSQHSLETHQSLHKTATKLQKYSCTKCNYTTKYECDLTSHQNLHKEVLETRMYKCDSCSYETKHIGKLRSHQQTHEKSSTAQLYKCDVCNYQTEQKGNLNIHQLLHGDVVQWGMYQCTQCNFKTKVKSYLTSHLSIHNSSCETL